MSHADLEQMKKQYHIGMATPGKLVGELSMQYEEERDKNKRLFSCFAESEFCIVILLNHVAFGTLLKEKLKRDRELLT